MSSWFSKCKYEVIIYSQQQLTPGISSQQTERAFLKEIQSGDGSLAK